MPVLSTVVTFHFSFLFTIRRIMTFLLASITSYFSSVIIVISFVPFLVTAVSLFCCMSLPCCFSILPVTLFPLFLPITLLLFYLFPQILVHFFFCFVAYFY